MWILLREPGPTSGPYERLLGKAQRRLAEHHAAAFRRRVQARQPVSAHPRSPSAVAPIAEVRIVRMPPDRRPFGAILRELAAAAPDDAGAIILGAGSIPLAGPAFLNALLDTATTGRSVALANSRYSADVVAVGRAAILRDVPDLPSDNALPRWLEEQARVPLVDRAGAWRLALDIDSPTDLVLLAHARRPPKSVRELGHDPRLVVARQRLADVIAVAGDPRAELLVAGRTSAATLRWLETSVAARVRALIEERGLRASSPLAGAGAGGPRGVSPRRPPASVIGLVLEDRPEALGRMVARLADAAVMDTRVLLAHRLGADERAWPSPEDRFASDALDPGAVHDPWLRALTEAAVGASVPIVLGGHTLVGPGLRLALGPPGVG